MAPNLDMPPLDPTDENAEDIIEEVPPNPMLIQDVDLQDIEINWILDAYNYDVYDSPLWSPVLQIPSPDDSQNIVIPNTDDSQNIVIPSPDDSQNRLW